MLSLRFLSGQSAPSAREQRGRTDVFFPALAFRACQRLAYVRSRSPSLHSDLLALSVIPLQRARGIVHDGSHIQYSDYFDFYPWVYHEAHKHLVCNTPAQLSLHEVRVFRGQTSPILSALDFNHMDVDNPLLNALLRRWRIRYGTKRPEWSDRALFRSLNMAAAASKMPAGVDLTTFSLGRNIGLWVSAFEILIVPDARKSSLGKEYP